MALERAERFADGLDRFVQSVGRIFSWCFVALVAVIIFDVITRRFLVLGSTKLQELEWHIHTLLFSATLAYGYVRNAHVRVDLVRERLGLRAKAMIELLGILFLLLPFLVVVIYFGSDFAHRAFTEGEVSSAGTGLPYRWIVKAFIPVGFALLLMAALSRIITCIRDLSSGSSARRVR